MLSERLSRNVGSSVAPFAKRRDPAPAGAPLNARVRDSARNSDGIDRVTRVPEPTIVISRPSAVSCANTALVVFRETPSSSASRRVDGSKAPGGSLPVNMASRIASPTCW